ncbi:MAG: hypothetical protein AAB803_02195 [Patescibacteria group bacterium]
MFKSKNALLFGSIGLIVLAITVTTILERTKQTAGGEDVRARASATGTLTMKGIVSAVDETKRVVIVDNVQFEDQAATGKNLGTWTVTPPGSFNLTSLYTGAKVALIVNPTTFLASTKTLTALEIKVIR